MYVCMYIYIYTLYLSIILYCIIYNIIGMGEFPLPSPIGVQQCAAAGPDHLVRQESKPGLWLSLKAAIGSCFSC